jgi:hypothetical protein
MGIAVHLVHGHFDFYPMGSGVAKVTATCQKMHFFQNSLVPISFT